MLDLQHPRSAAILRAARHLDALRALGPQAGTTPPPEVARAAETELAALAELASREFAEAQASIHRQLRHLAAAFGRQPARPADPAGQVAAALAQLEQDFGTWLI